MIFEFYEQKYFEKVYLKWNLAQPTKQERSQNLSTAYHIMIQNAYKG